MAQSWLKKILISEMKTKVNSTAYLPKPLTLAGEQVPRKTAVSNTVNKQRQSVAPDNFGMVPVEESFLSDS